MKVATLRVILSVTLGDGHKDREYPHTVLSSEARLEKVDYSAAGVSVGLPHAPMELGDLLKRCDYRVSPLTHALAIAGEVAEREGLRIIQHSSDESCLVRSKKVKSVTAVYIFTLASR